MHTLYQGGLRGGGIHMEGEGGMELKLLHLSQRIWGMEFWGFVMGRVASAHFYSGTAEYNSEVWVAEVCHGELAALSDISRDMDCVSAQVRPRRIFYEQSFCAVL